MNEYTVPTVRRKYVISLGLTMTVMVGLTVYSQHERGTEVVTEAPDRYRLTNINATLADAIDAGTLVSGRLVALSDERLLHSVTEPYAATHDFADGTLTPVTQMALTTLALVSDGTFDLDGTLSDIDATLRTDAMGRVGIRAALQTLSRDGEAHVGRTLAAALRNRVGTALLAYLDDRLIGPAAQHFATGDKLEALGYVFSALANGGRLADYELFDRASVTAFLQGSRGMQHALGFGSWQRPGWSDAGFYTPIVGQLDWRSNTCLWTDAELGVAMVMTLHPTEGTSEEKLDELRWRLSRIVYEALALSNDGVERVANVLP